MRITLGYQWKSQQLRFLFIATIGLWALCAIALTFFDLPISIALVDYNSQWAEAVASYGEVPGYILISICLTLILREKWTRSRWVLDPTFWVTYIFNIVVIILLLGDLLQELFLEDIGEEILVLGVLIMQYLIIFLSKNVEWLSQRKTMNFAQITYYLAFIIPLIYVQLIKQLWGRVRFRDLAVNYTDFTPWYQPQINTGNYSFPSGHTAMGWMLLPILFLLINKDSWSNRIIGAIVIIWGVIVALGRIVIGAHYASDVVFSTGGAFITFIILYNQFSINSSDDVKEV
jgi:membrane-associated phospholipid phosphatase